MFLDNKKNQKNLEVDFCFQETVVWEELGRFERHWHVRRKKCFAYSSFIFGETSLEKG